MPAHPLSDVDADLDEERVIEWLLAGDPSIRWQVMRDLLGLPEEQVGIERARVATGGWGARLLAAQDSDGCWAGALYSPKWISTTYTLLLLERHPIAEVLLRFGRGDDPRVRRALKTTIDDLAATAQGRGWPCRPDDVSGFRGPGRKHDLCPQATLQALRAWSYVPVADHPVDLAEVARVSLRVWRSRGDEQPHMFGHGSRFKTVKWPATWYDVHGVLDALGRYPALWRGPDADPDDRRSLAELVACLIAYNVADDGTVTPRSCYRGFEDYSFGQKKHPSPFATARLLQVLARFADLRDEAAAVDATSLGSSRGGTGTARPPSLPARRNAGNRSTSQGVQPA